MPIVYFIVSIAVFLLFYTFYNLVIIKKVYNSHKSAHTEKYTNNGKFNEAYNLISSPSEEKTFHLRPIINIDDEKIRVIVFMNNVNSITLTSDQRLAFDLNLVSKGHTSYYFVTDNYQVDKNQSITQNLMTNNFPKLFQNDTEYYNVLNLKDLGYPLDVKIKADDIVTLVFDGKVREMVIITNDIYQSGYYIKYKSKKNMMSKIKETSLYKHIMQWGLPGFSDSMLTYMENSSTEDKTPSVYKNVVKDAAAKLPDGAQTYIEERILE